MSSRNPVLIHRLSDPRGRQHLASWVEQRRTGVLSGKGDGAMVTYVILMKMTEQGIKEVKNAPARIEQGIKTFETMGGKVTAFYSVMGEYDYVTIGDAPNDEVALTFLLGLCSQGSVRTTTLKAFTREQFAAAVGKLP
jgi:uncharacterized protein with GYD domain